MTTVKPDWRIVKLDQTVYVKADWLASRHVTACGMYYLVDANLHVHICSLTPSLEMWPMHAWAEYATPEASETDEGETELEVARYEEPCSYYDTDVLSRPNISAAKYVPEREEGETDNAFYDRTVEEVREYLCGNPVCF